VNEVRIDPEFSCLCPILTDEERDGLRASVKAHGCRDPLVVWKEEGLLLDGHNRLAACKEFGVEFETVSYSFPDRDAARAWIVDNQLARRNLAPQQASYLRGLKYRSEKLPPGNPEQRVQSGHVARGQTRDRVAKATGVSSVTIQRDAKFSEDVDKIAKTCPAAKRAILSGEVKVSREQAKRAASADVRTVSDLRKLVGPATAPTGRKNAARAPHRCCKEVNGAAYKLRLAINGLRQAGIKRGDREQMRALWSLLPEIQALDTDYREIEK